MNIGTVWLNRHKIVSRLDHVDHTFLVLNLLLLMIDSLLPFPTHVVGHPVLGEQFEVLLSASRTSDVTDVPAGFEEVSARSRDSGFCWEADAPTCETLVEDALDLFNPLGHEASLVLSAGQQTEDRHLARQGRYRGTPSGPGRSCRTKAEPRQGTQAGRRRLLLRDGELSKGQRVRRGRLGDEAEAKD